MRLLAAMLIGVTLLCPPAPAQAVVHTPSARISCPGDVVVWVNTQSGVYHHQEERYFGSTKQGRFLCEKAARAEGDRPTRNGQ